jgi:hypothetical protein
MAEIKGSLSYSKDTIQKIKNDMSYEKATMSGFYNDLLKLKTNLEKFYDKHLFYLGYSLSDAPYHGWSGEFLNPMSKIDQEISKRFKEIYAIVLCGLGEEVE